MLALTLIDCNKQNPVAWASAMECGLKTIESRVWPVPPKYMDNGPFDLLICASKSSKTPNAGKAVCIVEVFDCKPMVFADEPGVGCSVYPKAWYWHTRNLRLLKQKFPVTGRFKLFEVELPKPIETSTFVPTMEDKHKLFRLRENQGFMQIYNWQYQTMLYQEYVEEYHRNFIRQNAF